MPTAHLSVLRGIPVLFVFNDFLFLLSLNKPVIQNEVANKKHNTKEVLWRQKIAAQQLDERNSSCCLSDVFLTQHFYRCKWDQNNVYTQSVLAIHEHFKLFVIELCFLLWDEGTFSTLAHRVHKAHARQRHFFAAAFVTEALPTSSAVMLSVRECFIRLRNKWLGNNVVKFLH